MALQVTGKGWIRVNQIGYLPETPKVGVYIGEETSEISEFEIKYVLDDKVIYTGSALEEDASVWGMREAFRLDFSELEEEVGDSPTSPHSAFPLLLNENTTGGLVDGPVYKHIFENLKGIALTGEDEYTSFQLGKAVYHDDAGDYSTNEPTMDVTASLMFYLSSMERYKGAGTRDKQGALVRFDSDKPTIYLVFPADRYFEGAQQILDVLKESDIKASFFLTGNCLRNKANSKTIKQIIAEGHYLGPHSDEHLLYVDWSNRDSLLVTRKQFKDDLLNNLKAIEGFGLNSKRIRWFLPPYEWYNSQIVDWSNDYGIDVLSFTPGTGTNADYTTPEMDNYRDNETLLSGLWSFEANDINGLNGIILLIHPGVHPDRNEKFYENLKFIIKEAGERGYQFGKLQ